MSSRPRAWYRRVSILGGVIVVVLIVVLPFLRDREDVRITAALRRGLSGEGHRFAKLDEGWIHYELAGPEGAPLVVLIHGVSGPMEVWDAAVGDLQGAGFRTLRFDHYGRGWSDRIEGEYDLDRFAGTVEGLLAAVGGSGRVHLLGSSMGAIVSAELASRSPDRVERVVLLGPAGFPIEAGPLARLIRVPGLGDWMMKVAGDDNLAAHNRRYFVAPERFRVFQARFEAQLRVVGSKSAILSTMRHTPVQSYLSRYRVYGALEKPTLLVWGRQDAVFPYAHHREALDAIPHAELLTCRGRGSSADAGAARTCDATGRAVPWGRGAMRSAFAGAAAGGGGRVRAGEGGFVDQVVAVGRDGAVKAQIDGAVPYSTSGRPEGTGVRCCLDPA